MSTKLPSYLRLRGRIIWYKRRVPKHLRHLPPFNGQSMYDRSLEVHTVAEARRVIAEEGIDRLFEDRSPKAADNAPLIEVTDEIINGLMNEMYNRSASRMYTSRMSEPLEIRILRDATAAQDVGALNDEDRAERTRHILKRDQEDVRRSMA